MLLGLGMTPGIHFVKSKEIMGDGVVFLSQKLEWIHLYG